MVPSPSRSSLERSIRLICALDTLFEDLPEFGDIQSTWYPYTLLTGRQHCCDRLAEAGAPFEGVVVRAFCNDFDIESLSVVCRAGVVPVVFIELNFPFRAYENSCHG